MLAPARVRAAARRDWIEWLTLPTTDVVGYFRSSLRDLERLAQFICRFT